MRILHIVHQYPPDKIGGTEFYTQQLAQEQVRAGHQVALFAPSTVITSETPFLKAGVIEYRPLIRQRDAVVVFLSAFRQPTLEKAFLEAVADFTPDLIHIEHLMGLPAKIIDHVVSAGIPFVVTLHDYWFICANAQLLTNYDQTTCSGPDRFLNCARCAIHRAGQPALGFFSPLVAPLLARRNHVISPVLLNARKIVAPTEFVKQEYERILDLDTPIDVVGHGIDLPEAQIKPRTPVEESLKIMYVGGLSWQKGVHILIDAVNMTPLDGMQLDIYGDTSAFPDYVNNLRGRIHHPGIKISGRLERQDFWTALASHDLIVVPSLWYETASLIVQESFAAGVPVLASRIGALEERVSDGVNGLLFTPGDVKALHAALISLYDRPALRQSLQAGIQPVQSIQGHAREIEEIYRDALVE